MERYNHFSENDELKKLGLSVRAYNYCTSRGLSTIRQLLDYFFANNNSIPAGQNAGFHTVSELTRVCRRLQESIEVLPSGNEKYGSIADWELSVRAYNVLQVYRLVTKERLLTFYFDNGQSIPKDLRNCGRKTINEIEELCKFLIQESDANEILPNRDKQGDTTRSSGRYIQQRDNTLTSRLLANLAKLASLSHNDFSHFSSYMEQYGHYPLLWLLSKYIESDEDTVCFMSVYGIDSSKKRRTSLRLLVI